MKSLAVSEKYGWPRYVAHQAYYSLVGREYEWELMPLGPRPEGRRGGVESARLGAADRQDPPRPAAAATSRGCRTRSTRRRAAGRRRVSLPRGGCDRRGRRGDRQDRAADRAELAAPAPDRVHRRSSARATRSSCGRTSARSAGTSRPSRSPRLDAASAVTPIYPYWHQRGFAERNPFPTD